MAPPVPVERAVAALVRHPWRILAAALVPTLLSVLAIVHIPMFTSRKALVPQNAAVTHRLERYLEKFGAASDLIVILENAPRDVLAGFASDLATRLRRLPEVAQASERIELQFFFDHAYLLVPPRPLSQFAALLQKLIGIPAPRELDGWEDAFGRVERWLDEPPPLSTVDVDMQTAEGGLYMVQFFLDEWLRWLEAPAAPAAIDWQSFLQRHGEAQMAASGGYFTSRDGKMFFLFVRASNSSEEFEVIDPFVRGVRQAAEDLGAEYRRLGKPAPRVALAGLPAVSHEEFSTLRHDILFTILTAAGLIILLIVLWLRSLRWALIVFIPMGVGVVWNIGVTYLFVGHMTMITSGFTAILFGLGVDYGIFMSSRIFEERRADRPLAEAVARGVAFAAKALVIAGGATVLIFAALGTVPFSGFSELGKVAASGVLMVLLSTFALQPVLFVLIPPGAGRTRPAEAPGRKSPAKTKLKLSTAVSVFLVLVAFGGALGGVVTGSGLGFDYDLLSLLPRDSEIALYQRRMEKESDFKPETIIFTADSMDEARRIARRARQLPSIAQVQSVTDFFPANIEERLLQARQIGSIVATSAYLKKIMDLGEAELSPTTMDRILSSLEKTETLMEDAQEAAFNAGHKNLVGQLESILSRLGDLREKLEEDPERARSRTEKYTRSILTTARQGFDLLSSWRYARALRPEQLPAMLRNQFIAKDGTVAIYAHPAKTVYEPENLEQLNREVYSVSSSATGFPTTHQVFSHMAVTSFKQGTLLAVLIATAWILLILRNLQGFIIALLPLLVGGGWMMGAFALFGMKFSYANIIALPMVMGLAVDYGVWFAHRHREMPDSSAWHVAVVAGRAILLAAGTTLAGLGAISLASYRGVANMGIAITIGLVCCVTAALLVSPAVAGLLFRRKP